MNPAFFSAKAILLINELLPAPAGPVNPMTVALPEFLKIFLINFLESLSLFSIEEIMIRILKN